MLKFVLHLQLQCFFVCHFWLNWDLKMLVFEEKRKPEYSEINLSEQKRERTTSSTHIWCRRLDLTTLVRGKCSRYCAILVPPPPPLSEIEVNLYCEHEYRDWPINVGCALAPVKSSSYNFQYFSQYQHLPSTNICIHQPGDPPVFLTKGPLLTG